MGLHPETAGEAFWNKDHTKGPVHETIHNHISLKRWQQIKRFFHISKPKVPGQEQESPFEKLEPLSEQLRQKFKEH